MKTIVVSPHLDDAALSACAHLAACAQVAGGQATVVTVFTALPAADRATTWWDRLTGAASSRERQRERLAEDDAAMRLLAARGVHLDELEALYRDGEPDLDRAIRRMTSEFASCDEVWLPSAIGEHPDHRAARDAGYRAARAAGHQNVVLYADFPYLITYGWPSWVTGETADPYLDASFWLADQLTVVGLDPAALTPVVTRLSAEQRRVKATVIAAYLTQAAALGLTPTDLDRDPGKLDYELCWRMPLGPAAP